MDYRQAAQRKKSPHTPEFASQMEWKRLLCALAVFGTVFLGKQIYPEKVVQVGRQVLAAVEYSLDLEDVFSDFGSSLNAESGPLEGLETFCIEVFGPRINQDPVLPETENRDFFSEIVLQKTGLLTGIQQTAMDRTTKPISDSPEMIPTIGTVLSTKESTQPFPAGYTPDKLSFGGLETVTPVNGVLNSGFGYRDHPVNGEHRFHAGVDIGADAGTPIAAFAAGTVDYIGEDASYGRYLQLDHGNGIKSFYAHCQELCVKKGQQVTAGETVALVGSTGTTTGPHLHLELKYGEMRVDPAYYLEFLSA